MSQFSFRIQGPGVDIWQVANTDDLDEVLNFITLAVEKFKRDAASRGVETKVDYAELIRFCELGRV